MKLLTISLAVLIVVVAGTYLFTNKSVPYLGNISRGTTTATSTANVSTTPQLILAANSGRQFISVINQTAVPVYVSCNTTATSLTAGIGYFLAPSTTLTLIEEQGTMWCSDNLYGITSSGTSTVGVMAR